MDNTLPTVISNYDDAVRWIYDRIDYERIRPIRTSTHFRLERVEQLLSLIDSPQKRIPAVHIAGTKGKGSTAAMLDSMLSASGIRSGLFTSPHIHQFEERMRVCGNMPSPDELTSLVTELSERLAKADLNLIEDGPTYFEVATLLAWMYFDRHEVEIAVLETGLGGRLDCTNVCSPLLTVITAIGLDHTQILGNTIAQIATEKAGILKQGVPVIAWTGATDADTVIAKKANSLGCDVLYGNNQIRVTSHRTVNNGQQLAIATPTREHTDLFLPLFGEHQSRNAALAVAAADLLSATDPRITDETISDGLKNVTWPLRFELIRGTPDILLDAAHNPDAVDAFVQTLDAAPLEHSGSRVLIFGSSQDKDAESMLKLLAPRFPRIVLTKFVENPRAVAPEALRDLLPTRQEGLNCEETPEKALAAAIAVAGDDGLVCGTGSIFLAAELRSIVLSRTP